MAKTKRRTMKPPKQKLAGLRSLQISELLGPKLDAKRISLAFENETRRNYFLNYDQDEAYIESGIGTPGAEWQPHIINGNLGSTALESWYERDHYLCMSDDDDDPQVYVERGYSDRAEFIVHTLGNHRFAFESALRHWRGYFVGRATNSSNMVRVVPGSPGNPERTIWIRHQI